MVSHHALSFKLYENSSQAPSQARCPAGIFRSSKNKGLLVSHASVSRIIKKLKITGSMVNLPCLGRPTKLSVDAKAFIDQQMRKKGWDYKSTDSEDASKMWDCREFVHHMKISPTARLDSAADRLLSVHPRCCNIRRSHISSIVLLWYM